MENHLLASGGVFGQPLKASVRSTSSEQLINFYPSSFETGSSTGGDDILSDNSILINSQTNTSSISSHSNSHYTNCSSSYSKSHHQSIKSPYSASHLIDRCNTSSSSCENFRNHNDLLAPTLPISRLSKASSDNPIQISHDSLVPPIPPRDYFASKQKLSKHSNIHPILQDGQKLSSTHYWLLPDKQTPSDKANSEVTRRKSDYVNFKEIEKNTPNSQSIQNHFQTITKPSRDLLGKFACGLKRQDDDVSLLGDFNREGEGCDNEVDINSIASGAYNIDLNNASKDVKEISMLEAGWKMEAVREGVDGVTLEESQTVLTMCGWDVERAVEYLKVENLFRLGLASRLQCKLVLQANQWNLPKAASDLVDLSR